MTIETYDVGLKPFAREIEDARRRAAKARTFGRLVQLGTVAGILVLWELAVVLMGVNPIILPRVSVIARSLWTLVADGTIPWHALVTLGRVFLGFAAASVLGIGIGLAMNRFAIVRNSVDPLIAGLYPLPKVALIPLLLIWFGSGETYKFLIVLMTAFFPVVISTYQGLRQVDDGLISAAGDLGADDWRIQWEVMLPAAMPAILSGMRLGMGVAIVLTIAAEMIASQSGLGYLLVAYGAILETEKVFAVLFTVAILGVVITKVQDWLDIKLAGWAFD
jgi:NitT/TauT family transport system permease protein